MLPLDSCSAGYWKVSQAPPEFYTMHLSTIPTRSPRRHLDRVMRQCRQTDRLVAALHTYYSCKVSVLNYYYDKKFMSKTAFSYYPVTSLRFPEPAQLEITTKSLYLKLRYQFSDSQHKNSRLLITDRHIKLCCL